MASRSITAAEKSNNPNEDVEASVEVLPASGTVYDVDVAIGGIHFFPPLSIGI